MGVSEVLSAIQSVSAECELERRNYGDLEALMRNNPFIAAMFEFCVSAVVAALALKLEGHLTPPAHELFDYAKVAKEMGKSQTSVRKMKERGQIIPVDHLVNGKTMFTKEAVESAVAASEIRHERTRERQARTALSRSIKPRAA